MAPAVLAAVQYASAESNAARLKAPSANRFTTCPEIRGLRCLWAQTLGDPSIRIAVLDGPVD
jgi:hypothetical protein